MSKDKGEWGLQLCDKCGTMTNHDDDGCLRCRSNNQDNTAIDEKLEVSDE